MPSFLSGLATAATAGVTGALEGRTIGMRRLLAEQARKEAATRTQQAQELAERKEANDQEQRRIENLMKGYTPGSTSITTEPDPAPRTPALSDPTASIGDALEGGMGPFAPASTPEGGSGEHAPPLTAGTSLAPAGVASGSLGTVPRLRVLDTPESYDPSTSAAAAGIAMRGEQARHLAADRQTAQLAQIALRDMGASERGEAANASRERVTAIRAGGRGGGGVLTANGRETAKQKLLDGLMQYHGSEGALRSYLDDSDVGKGAVSKFGITDADITATVGRATGQRVNQVMRTDKRNPVRAAARGDTARAAIVKRMQGGLRDSVTTPVAGGDSPPKAPPRARPAAPPAAATLDHTDETAKYQAAVETIKANYADDPAERDRRLAQAQTRYNSRVAAGAGGRR